VRAFPETLGDLAETRSFSKGEDGVRIKFRWTGCSREAEEESNLSYAPSLKGISVLAPERSAGPVISRTTGADTLIDASVAEVFNFTQSTSIAHAIEILNYLGPMETAFQ
jgi:hypothetical protein